MNTENGGEKIGKVGEWIPSSGTTSKIIDLEAALFVHALLLLGSSFIHIGHYLSAKVAFQLAAAGDIQGSASLIHQALSC